MPRIVVRKMRESDLNVVSELAMLANPELSFIAAEDGRVVGYAQADARNDEAVLEDIAVAEEYQRRGIGKELLRKELKVLKRKGVKRVMAEVHYKCASAIPFYYKHNFRIAGFVQDYFGMGHEQ